MTAQSLVLDVKIIPKSSHNQIVGIRGKYLVIKIHAIPENGKANKELLRFLSTALNIPQSAITITKGHTSAYKKLAILNTTQQDIIKLLSL